MTATAIDPTPVFYGGDELQDAKLQAVQEALARHDLDGLLLIKHEAVRYVTGFYAKGYRPFLDFDYLALVPREGLPVLATSLPGEESRARLRSRAGETRTLPGVRDWAEPVASLLRDCGLAEARVGFDLLPHYLFLELQEALPGIALIDASSIWTDVTAIKLPGEIALLREALRIAQNGMRAAMNALVSGVTEIEISAEAEYVMRQQGSEMNPFIPVVASGANAALWERVATDRRIGEGEMVILDFGCVYRGYTGDFARTTVVGEPSPAQRRLYRGAYDALQEAVAAVRPGVLCSHIDALARSVMREAGLGNYIAPWAIGHQLGYGLHGSPVIGPGVDVPLRAGMVINIEPALNTPDDPSIGGVEIEDTVLVTGQGCERLTDFPYDERLLHGPQ